MVSLQRVVFAVLSSAIAGAAGGAAVWAFASFCRVWNYTAEVSGQVVIGTLTYGVARQVADLVVSGKEHRALRRHLSALLWTYARDARARQTKERNVELLERDLHELRKAVPTSERDAFNNALTQLKKHGPSTCFSNLDEGAPLADIEALIQKLK